jgi:dihydrofolate reductase
MPQKLRVHNLSISLDGYAAGAVQSREDPLGVGGLRLHEWMFVTATWRRRTGEGGGDVGIDDDFLAAGDVNVGATIMGRNMFGPIRGDWGDGSWRGWWGDDPPFHHPVFVLTHHPRAPLAMTGGTTFHFVTEGPAVALERAFTAAGGKDVRLGGGAATIQQYLRTRSVDEMHVAIAPVLLGRGERLFDDLGDAANSYRCVELVSSRSVVHMRLARPEGAGPAAT